MDVPWEERTAELAAVEVVDSVNAEAPRATEFMDRGFGQGLIRTVLVFLDLPVHYEFRSSDMPLMPEGTKIEFDMELRNPKDPRRVRKVQGEYMVMRRKLVYETSRPSMTGLSQFLELSPHGRGKPS